LAEDSGVVRESIVLASTCTPESGPPPGVELYTYVSGACGAQGFSTGTAHFIPNTCLPYHLHRFSEAVTVIEGVLKIVVEGRSYRLHPRDCIHLPAGVAHLVCNDNAGAGAIAHWAFATTVPSRELVDTVFAEQERGDGNPSPGDPETIIRYKNDAIYELSQNAFFIDLFARRFGSVGICGGHGRFMPGASLPCHVHDFDESITIIGGRAVCLVEGKRYELSDCDTAFIPKGIPHRFLNESDGEMEMIWVYAGSEPDRRIVASGYCSGVLPWPGPELAQSGEK
jgi:quercetin dioxygenase-like cupin family protein